MKQDFKRTFNQITMNRETENTILSSYYSSVQNNCNHNHVNKYRKKLALALGSILLIFIPTITVFASTDFARETFQRLFGTYTEVLKEHSTVPEVKVLNNTFKDVKIDVKGITGDENTVYILLDITKKDTNIMNADDYYYRGGLDLYKNSEYIKSIHPEINQYSITDNWINIPDDNVNDNKITIAYIANIKTSINERSTPVLCNTYFFNLSIFYKGNSNNKEDYKVGYASWQSELTVNYDPADSISLEVNKSVKLDAIIPDKKEKYININKITLSPLSLKINTDNNNTNSFRNTFLSIYIEMKDGSIIGYKDLEDATSNKYFTGYHIDRLDDEICWVLPEVIDINKTKSVHIGNIEIPIPHDR